MSIGLLLSISFIMAGAQIIVIILEKFPALIWAGAALLGWIAGGMLAAESLIQKWIYVEALPATTAFGVLVVGFLMNNNRNLILEETDE